MLPKEELSFSPPASGRLRNSERPSVDFSPLRRFENDVTKRTDCLGSRKRIGENPARSSRNLCFAQSAPRRNPCGSSARVTKRYRARWPFAVTGAIVGIHSAQQVSTIAGAGYDTVISMSRIDAVWVGMIENPKRGAEHAIGSAIRKGGNVENTLHLGSRVGT
jgi:hypothetical protein